MAVEHLEILVEEPSMERALTVLLPKILTGPTFQIYSHRGKADLIRKLPARLNGYRSWLDKNWRIIIMVDRDGDDCVQLKKKIENMAREAGFGTPSSPKNGAVEVFVRIVVEELEAWYFGDWAAVASAFPRVPAGLTSRAAYRNPDAISGGTWEAFERVLKKSGYFPSGLQKLAAADTIAGYMNPELNQSASFQILRKTLMTFKGN